MADQADRHRWLILGENICYPKNVGPDVPGVPYNDTPIGCIDDLLNDWWHEYGFNEDWIKAKDALLALVVERDELKRQLDEYKNADAFLSEMGIDILCKEDGKTFEGVSLAKSKAFQQAKRYKQALEELAEYDCSYGDNCPTFGTNHGQCHGCIAREALQEGDK